VSAGEVLGVRASGSNYDSEMYFAGHVYIYAQKSLDFAIIGRCVVAHLFGMII
jgi:hypothetical protein